ncbi:MAG: DEAD/DEAH box helicase, partial [bacterium]
IMTPHSPTPPLPHLFSRSPYFQSALEKIRAGEQARLENLQGLSLALLLWAILKDSARPLLIVTPTPESAYRLEEELLFLSRNSGEGTRILAFPDYEIAESANPAAVRKTRRARLTALDLLYRCDRPAPAAILATPGAARRRTLSRETYVFGTKNIRIGDGTTPSLIADFLRNTGYEPAAAVEHPGQFSRRGGLLDVFPPTADEPSRIEFLSDRIEEIRPFSPETQRSRAPVNSALITPAWETTSPPPHPPTNLMRADHREALLHGHHIDGSVLYPSLFQSTASITDEADCEIVVIDEEDGREEFSAQEARSLRWLRHEGFDAPDAVLDNIYLPADALYAKARIHVSAKPSSDPAAAPIHRLPPLPLDLSQMAAILRHECERASVFVVSRFHSRLSRYLDEQGVHPAAILEGDLKGGFRLAAVPFADVPLGGAPLSVFTDAEVFPRRQATRVARVPAEDRAPVLIPSDIRMGDFVVHIDHGIGQYEGISTETLPDGRTGDFFSIRYGRGDRLFVPIEQLERIEKYIGATKALPRIYPLHSGRWGRVKRRVKEKIEELAGTLYRLYEERERVRGHAFPPDGMYMAELEASFPFDETPDQKRAIDEMKEDMERARPLDRLVFGDVGFGKTEVALRAAMKAAMDGRQTAMIAPTTLLVHQHDTTFRRRLARFPVTVESISRLKTPKERKDILGRLAAGKIDIVIGTHALLQKNVSFLNLGLIIVDEEQRFGVRHKEKLKLLKTNVDVLTLTAT